MSMQFNREQILRLAQQAREGPQKKIAVDLKRVKKESAHMQKLYLREKAKGPVSQYDFLNKCGDNKDTKYLCKNVFSLAKIIASGGYDKKKLDFMLKLGGLVESGHVREFDASVMVGQKFANEFIAPTVGEQQQEQKKIQASQTDQKDQKKD